ncbi:hypothetical protein GCM10012275_59430 [Longimycelium tulufanense]|uniref:Uncharacterized protein n=1 Tax=Longimycelium tulufanense TaxID=907463 RepID=A0A8J3CKA5_9PSEU|nr:hypothetical protein [Longimycelium tulufanense]GGM80910.1 hypothetical protein GCM10012275_59430 [Longimycelium tulufanense]
MTIIVRKIGAAPPARTGPREYTKAIDPNLPVASLRFRTSSACSSGRPLMKTGCERPYQSMIAAAGAVRRLPEDTSTWHVRQLATEQAHAVFSLDARMRAGLTPPRVWEPTAHANDPHEVSESGDRNDPGDSAHLHFVLGSPYFMT